MLYRRLQLLAGDVEQPDLVSLQEQLAVKDVARLAAVACEIERSILSPRGEDAQSPAEIHITVAEEEPARKDDQADSEG